MQSFAYSAIVFLLFTYASDVHSACYEIYRNDAIIYRSSVAPVDMSRPFSQTVPASFGEGATMIYQDRSNSCDSFDARLKSSGPSSTNGTQSSQSRLVTPRHPHGAVAAHTPMAASPSWDESYFADDYDGNGGATASGLAGTGAIYTGPRGGRYYINSNGNKTYVSSRGSSRGGRR